MHARTGVRERSSLQECCHNLYVGQTTPQPPFLGSSTVGTARYVAPTPEPREVTYQVLVPGPYSYQGTYGAILPGRWIFGNHPRLHHCQGASYPTAGSSSFSGADNALVLSVRHCLLNEGLMGLSCA